MKKRGGKVDRGALWVIFSLMGIMIVVLIFSLIDVSEKRKKLVEPPPIYVKERIVPEETLSLPERQSESEYMIELEGGEKGYAL